jgi:hypothetical protein
VRRIIYYGVDERWHVGTVDNSGGLSVGDGPPPRVTAWSDKERRIPKSMRRIIYLAVDERWHVGTVDDSGGLNIVDGPPPSVAKDWQQGKPIVHPFNALCSAEYIRLALNIPKKMPKDLTGEWEFEGFRYRLFAAGERAGAFQRFCIWCESCKEWVPAGRRFQEKHLRPLWKFKAEMERQ